MNKLYKETPSIFLSEILHEL